MNTIYKNCTDTILVISDLNIKFLPRGQRGDTLDLAKFFPITRIQSSPDLANAVRKKYLYSMAKGVRGPTTSVQVSPSGRNPVRPVQPQMFIVHNPVSKPKQDTFRTIVAYNNKEKKTELFTGTVPQQNTVKTNSAKVHVIEPVVVPVVEPVSKESVKLETKNMGCIEMTTKTVFPACQEAQAPAQVVSQPAVSLDESKCAFKKKDGKQCRHKRVVGSSHCYLHNQE